MKLAMLTAFAVVAIGAAPACAAGAADPSPAEASPFGAVASVSEQDMSAIVGKDDIAMTINARNTSEVSNNSVSGNSQTGAISFDATAFGNLNGLSLLSANTGNNVSINSSLNVNVSLHP